MVEKGKKDKNRRESQKGKKLTLKKKKKNNTQKLMKDPMANIKKG